MIRAEKKPLSQWALHRYIAWRLRRMFHSIILSGETEILEREEAYPLVIFSNHQSWWDGFLMQPLFERFRMDYYIMMEARNLRKFPFFRRAGVFGVDLDDAADRSAGLLYAGRLLKWAPENRRRVLLVYPHGRLLDPVEPWPALQPGLSKLTALNSRGRTVPLFLYLRMGKFPQPEGFLHLGEPLPAGEAPSTIELEDRLRDTREQLLERLFSGAGMDEAIALLSPPKHFHGKT